MLFNAIAGRADRKWVVMGGGARSWAVGFLGGFTQPVQRPCHAPLVRAKSIQPALRFWPPRNNKNSKKKNKKRKKSCIPPFFCKMVATVGCRRLRRHRPDKVTFVVNCKIYGQESQRSATRRGE